MGGLGLNERGKSSSGLFNSGDTVSGILLDICDGLSGIPLCRDVATLLGSSVGELLHFVFGSLSIVEEACVLRLVFPGSGSLRLGFLTLCIPWGECLVDCGLSGSFLGLEVLKFIVGLLPEGGLTLITENGTIFSNDWPVHLVVIGFVSVLAVLGVLLVSLLLVGFLLASFLLAGFLLDRKSVV